MPTYKIKTFVLGCDPKLTEQVVYIDADTEYQAEQEAKHGLRGEGLGIISTSQMDLDFEDFTKDQVDAIENEVHRLIAPIFSDWQDRDEVVDAIFTDVMADISETTDWSDLDDDEYCLDDVQIAVARVMKERLTRED